jgi:hypothetical protein
VKVRLNVHRWFTIAICLLSVALVGAGAPFASNTPSAVVFTLVPSGAASLESAARIAAAISVRLGSPGTVTVKSAPGEVKQADFQSAAQKLGVDYYVSGFVAPFGGGSSVALQVVSVASGASIWSGTATLNGTDDVGDAADVIGKVIVGRSSQLGYGPAPSGTAPPARTASPAPSPAAAAPRSASQAVAAAAAQGQGGAETTTAATTGRPSRTIAVLDSIDTNGRLKPQQVTYTTDAIAGALSQQGIVATRWHKTSPALDVSGTLLCTDTQTGWVLEPMIVSTSSDPDAGNGVWNTVRIQLVGFDCANHSVQKIAGKENSAFNWQVAADRSIGDAVKLYLTSAKAK